MYQLTFGFLFLQPKEYKLSFPVCILLSKTKAYIERDPGTLGKEAGDIEQSQGTKKG